MLSAIIFKTQAKEEGKRRQEKRRMGGWGGHSEHSTGTKEVKKRNGFLQNKQAYPFLAKPEELQGWLKLRLRFLVDHLYLRFLPSTREVQAHIGARTHVRMRTHSLLHTHVHTSLFGQCPEQHKWH